MNEREFQQILFYFLHKFPKLLRHGLSRRIPGIHFGFPDSVGDHQNVAPDAPQLQTELDHLHPAASLERHLQLHCGPNHHGSSLLHCGEDPKTIRY